MSPTSVSSLLSPELLSVQHHNTHTKYIHVYYVHVCTYIVMVSPELTKQAHHAGVYIIAHSKLKYIHVYIHVHD